MDPLYVIFEQHLFNFADPNIDRKTLILKIVSDYLNFLRKRNISVPKSLEQPIVEELAIQVSTMLIKKIYGCLSPQDYLTSNVTRQMRKRARSRYARLHKPAKSAKISTSPATAATKTKKEAIR